MPPPSSSSGIRDNHSRGSVGDFLRQELRPGAGLDLVTAYFTVFAYDKLRAELNHLGKIRLLFGEAAFIKNLDPELKNGAAYVLRDDGLTLANGLNQRHLAQACAAWMRDKVEVRSVTKTGFLHGKMTHITRGEVTAAIVGSSNFTTRGLGLAAANNNVELNLVVDGNRDRADLRAWFEELWNDTSRVEDVKQRVLDYLLQVYADQSPEFIYYKTLYELFRRYIEEGLALDDTLRQIRLPDTGIWKALYTFQRDGARSAINKIKNYNGCILADSVGLGKTYTALAVIKYFELRNEKVLVLCPKKLRRNWSIYRQPSALNPFEADRFRFDVLHHTDLSRTTGESNGLDLGTLNWGAYDLVVIDESHNFRNNKPATQRPGEPEKRSRYQRLMDDIISAGVKTKVLLLSATPVNNQLADLRNQISFIAGGDVARVDEANEAFVEKLGIASVRETTRLAQTHFTNWAKRPPGQRKTRDLIAAIGGDFFKLLDGLSLARSRRQIASHYVGEMQRLGGFPHRPPPRALHAPIDLNNGFLSFEQLDTEIGALRLALYHPTSFLRDDLPSATRAAYQAEILGGFTQEGREKILIAMMKVNFLKRLESSVDSFRLTLGRTIAKIDDLEKRITAFEHHLDANPELDFDSLTPDQFEDPDFDGEDFTIGGRRRIHLGHLKLSEWLKAVRNDRTQLQFLLEKTQSVTAKRDGKLAELKQLIAAKVAQPTVNRDGKPNRKILVFTAFADTARYLYENISPWAAELNRKSDRGGPPLPQNLQGQAAPATLFQPFERKGAVSITRQNLPHWSQPGATYFVTYRLADSLPRKIFGPWREEIALWLSRHPGPWDDATCAEYQEFFARKEAWLDAGYGACLLGEAKARAIVEENLRRFDGARYILDEFVIMPNHVHVLVKPLGDHTLSDILHSWKSFTGKFVAKTLGLESPVWMDESFDHIVRTWEQLEHYRAYIRENPKTKILQSGRGGSPLTQNDRGGPPLVQNPQGQAASATPVLHTGLVCGDGGNAASLGLTDFDDILTNFSPLAKRRADQVPGFPNQREEIDLLIATDCISEGQNLQDCDLLVNYDIHWNPVRIIQRFGRIDRIGSRNDAVQLVNFWPVADLDRYLGVKHRVEARMALVDLAATQTDNLLDTTQIEDLIKEDLLFRDRQLRRLKDEILDLDDLDDSISLTDFSLDEFRQDLLNFLQAHKAEMERAPLGLYAVVPPAADIPMARPGVIYCLRQKTPADSPTGERINPLAPHYLVYVHATGEVRLAFVQAKTILNLFRSLALGKSKPYVELCRLFDRQTRQGDDMSAHTRLIGQAVTSITATYQQRLASGLQGSRQFVLPTADEQPQSGSAFELVTWLVLLAPDS